MLGWSTLETLSEEITIKRPKTKWEESHLIHALNEDALLITHGESIRFILPLL